MIHQKDLKKKDNSQSPSRGRGRESRSKTGSVSKTKGTRLESQHNVINPANITEKLGCLYREGEAQVNSITLMMKAKLEVLREGTDRKWQYQSKSQKPEVKLETLSKSLTKS